MAISINLLPKEDGKKKEYDSYFKSVIILVIVTAFFVFITIGAKYAYNYYELNRLETELNQVDLKFSQEPVSGYLASYNTYKNHNARVLMANQKYYSQLVDHLNESLTPNIQLTEISLSLIQADVRGYSTKGMTALSVFQKNLDNRGYKDLKINSISIDQSSDRVDFSITFKYDSKIIERSSN